MKKTAKMLELEPLNLLHYDSDRVMIGHEVVPMDHLQEGVYWCKVCGGHPDDPVHQVGWVDEGIDGE